MAVTKSFDDHINIRMSGDGIFIGVEEMLNKKGN